MIIGYTQGTFDMFHIGHLNLLMHAREKCDYLIVGVNSDELVQEYKGKTPIISEEDRMAIVGSMRYVDKVVLSRTLDKLVALQKYHFDRIFIGDDWKGNSRWAATGVEMKEHGAELIYLPHTDNISSTMLRNAVKSK